MAWKPATFAIVCGLVGGLAPAAAAAPSLTFVPGSTVKLYQVNGDCDWEAWDASINQSPPTCVRTASQTATRADVLGDDVPVVFEHRGEMLITFGDTFGADSTRYPEWVSFENTFQWAAHDPIARSTSTDPGAPLQLDFFLDGNHALEVLPKTSGGVAVPMGADDVPSAGVDIGGQAYLAVTTGTVSSGGQHDHSGDYAQLVLFDEANASFTAGRVLSPAGGHFVRPIFRLDPAPASAPGTQSVWIFGIPSGGTGIYLSRIQAEDFWTGTLPAGGPGQTQYFSGLENGAPSWQPTDSATLPPIVSAADPSNPDIRYASVTYVEGLKLWVMIFDNTGKTNPNSGMYLTYAAQPWGPWSQPQLIFNACRDNGYGRFMFYYYATAKDNDCPAAAPGAPRRTGSSGPAGPTAGDQAKNIATTTRGIAYGPAIVDRFTTIQGRTLKLYFMLSTWNPYAVVMMQSAFQIGCPVGGGSCSTPRPAPPPPVRRAPRPRARALRAGMVE